MASHRSGASLHPPGQVEGLLSTTQLDQAGIRCLAGRIDLDVFRLERGLCWSIRLTAVPVSLVASTRKASLTVGSGVTAGPTGGVSIAGIEPAGRTQAATKKMLRRRIKLAKDIRVDMPFSFLLSRRVPATSAMTSTKIHRHSERMTSPCAWKSAGWRSPISTQRGRAADSSSTSPSAKSWIVFGWHR